MELKGSVDTKDIREAIEYYIRSKFDIPSHVRVEATYRGYGTEFDFLVTDKEPTPLKRTHLNQEPQRREDLVGIQDHTTDDIGAI